MKKRSPLPYAVLAVGIIAAGILGYQTRSANAVPADAVTMTAEADGFTGPVKVSVTATADKIYAVKVLENGETQGIGSKAIDQLPGVIVEKNSLAVDGVSGATFTSNAIKTAAADALRQAGFDAARFGAESVQAETTADTAMEIPADAIRAIGEAQGNNGPVKVEIVADKEKIYSVKVTEHQETMGIGDKAAEQLPAAIVAGQSLQVDAISGATVTSNAILEAVRAALASAGLDASVFEHAPLVSGEKADDVVLDTDIVIVGAGGAGMTAAIEAADAGKRVILLESQSMVGGNSVRATGGMNAADTRWQDENAFDEAAGVEKTLKTAAEKYADNAEITGLAKTVQEQWDSYRLAPDGYFDSVELMELDTMIGGKGINDFTLVKTLAENSAGAIGWLDTIGAELHNVGSFGGASVKRIHRPVNAEGKTTAVGAYMVPILEENVRKRENISLLLSTTAEEILTDGKGAAVGVKASGESGNTVTIHAKAVVLTTGGFGANLKMVEQYNPKLKGFMTTNAAGAQGQGIVMGEKAGAAVVDLDQIQIHPTVEANSAHLITEGLRGDGAILVNSEGKRFIDEVGTRDVVSAAEIAQPGSFAWLVIDQKMADKSAVIQGYIKSGYTVTGEDAAKLAAAMGVDGAAFSETLDSWNGYVAAKQDPDFSRTSFAEPLEGTLYAIKVMPGIHHTMGGLRINTKTEVLNDEGQAIAGLFAAGEVTGGVHGANRLGGNAVSDFTVFGRIAGENAAKLAG